MEPQPRLAGGTPHAVQPPLLVEAPDAADPLAHRVAEDPPRRGRLALVTGGQHDQVGGPYRPVLHDGPGGPEALDVRVLNQPDAAIDDHLGTAGVEVVTAAAVLVHDLPA